MKYLVVNSSPLIHLIKTEHDFILPKLAKEVIVPKAVSLELSVFPGDGVYETLLKRDFFKVVPDEINESVIAWDLGKGETAVISYALKYRNFTPVLDDLQAKACCSALGLKTVGTGSLLVLAKLQGIIPSVSSVLFDMRNKGMWVSDFVIDLLLKKAGE